MTETAEPTLTAGEGATALDEAAIRARFDSTEALTVGLEEEVLLLDPRTLAPVPLAAEVVTAAGDPRIKRELPSCQVELLSPPRADVAAAVSDIALARAALAQACGDSAAPAAAAVHPSVVVVDVSETERHCQIEATYGEVARRQLVGALQVHVALGSAEATLAVFNALRGHLPELAALAASAPFHEGRDTGLASIRPVICTQLPRQGVPPAIESWARFAEDLRWGAASGTVPEPRRWWWEARPHVVHGTIEVRVPDVQATLGATAAVAELVHALVSCLLAEHREGRDLGCPATWRIAENRWSALRDGVHGSLADLETGEPAPTRQRLHELIDRVEPHAAAPLDAARRLVERNGADELRAAGLRRAAAHLADAFSSPSS